MSKRAFLSERGLFSLLLVTLAILLFGGWLVLRVILPHFANPNNGMYGSKLGYASLLRTSGKPIPVKVGIVEERAFEQVVVGEGMCASDPYLVPVIPMAKVVKVNVQEGDFVKKGQVIAQMNETKALIKLESAKLALSTAESEFERVRLGSAYVLAQERPEIDKVNVSALKKLLDSNKSKLESFKKAHARGAISSSALMEVEREYEESLRSYKEAEIFLGMSEAGLKESLKIAENTVDDMREAKEHREEELRDYQVVTPADGVIERVLIREGEYNQDSGKPGFVIASGMWFEAHFDQTDYVVLQNANEASVYLESYPGVTHEALVDKVVPVVSFNQGGPEISRPLRPRGTGSPEWAATFKVRLTFKESQKEQLAIGMTGFARVKVKRNALSIPRGAVHSISAGEALVDIPDGEGWKSCPVKIGQVTETHAEVLSGLAKGDRVIIDGHWVLEPEDRVSYD